MAISGNQLKAARALLGFDQAQLAAAARVGINTIRNMESSGAASIRARTETLNAVEALLKAAGLVFLPEDGQGAGVRLRSVPQTNDELLIEEIDFDRTWLIRHKECDQANGLRTALEKANDLASVGHYPLSIRTPDDRIIIEPDQIRRLFVRLGLYRNSNLSTGQ